METIVKCCYVSPVIDFIEVCSEGVLCVSGSGDLGESQMEALEQNAGTWLYGLTFLS